MLVAETPGPEQATQPPAVADSVDRLLADWRRASPELELTPLGVVARLRRVSALLERELGVLLARHGLSSPSFAVLAVLARASAPLSQRALARSLGLSGGTISVRIDRLVAAGLVARESDPADRRGQHVALTARGRTVFAECAPEHLADEARLLSSLSPAESRELSALLRKLLLALEDEGRSGEGRLGAVVSPAHVTRALRRAVGLPERDGLLVREVVPGSAAARAGLREGDVLCAVDGSELRSLADLAAAVGGGDVLHLDVVRGIDERAVTVSLGVDAE